MCNVLINSTDSAEVFFYSDIYFVAFDAKYNVCYTLSGPNKVSKMYAAIK